MRFIFQDNQSTGHANSTFWSLHAHVSICLKDGRVHYYDVQYKGFNEDTKLVELGGLEGRFSEAVSENTQATKKILISK